MEKLITAVIPVLMSRDVDTSLRFYTKLGFATDFTDTPTQPRYAGISRDGVALHLQWQDAAHWDNALDRPAYRFAVGDVDALYTDFQAAGALPALNASPYAKPADTPWGTREFHLHDPDRNSLQFFAAE
jgi:catechol 2,3-dioxygenase-like lactoylglutathione lyase family enzyme